MNSDDNKLEEDCRIFACDLIQNAGILLRLPQVALTTAQMLLQRVYNADEYTLEKNPLDTTSMAALFLGAKIEEYPRKVCDVIDVFTYVLSRKLKEDIVLDYREHDRVKKELFTTERLLLKTLGFNLLSSYPHKIIVNYYHAIVHALDPEMNVWREHVNQKVLQEAWNYCNDSLRLDVFTRYSKVVVACACIQMACEKEGMVFPTSTEGLRWYSLFVENEQDVLDSINIIKGLYLREPVALEAVKSHLSLASNKLPKLHNREQLHRT